MSSLILGSGSPRRKEILQQLGISFEVIAPELIETIAPEWSPETAVVRLAEQKANLVSESYLDNIVLGSDTIVVFNDQCLGKPKSREQAHSWLKEMSGKRHKVYTSVALAKNSKIVCSDFQSTEVYFRKLSDYDIELFLDTNEYVDKAGAYGIQGPGARLIEKIDGCFYNVMGLPIDLTLNLLKRLGIE